MEPDGHFDNQEDGYTVVWNRGYDEERRDEWDIYVLLSVYVTEAGAVIRSWSCMSRNAQVGLPDYKNWEHA
jgi:hypothetical protein